MADENDVGQAGQGGVDGDVKISSPQPSTADRMTGTVPPQTFTLKVNGVSKTYDWDGLVRAAQKGEAADERFREASEIMNSAKAALAFKEDLKAVTEGDVDAFRRAAASLGLNEQEVESAVARYNWGEEEVDEDDDEDVLEEYLRGGQAGPQRGGGEPRSVSYADLSPDVQRALQRVERRYIETVIDEALDSDEDLRYNMRTLTDDGRGVVKDLVMKGIQGRLNAMAESDRDVDFGDGKAILREVLPEVKKVVKSLVPRQTHGPISMGPSPDGGTVHPTKKPEYVSSLHGDDSWTQNIIEEMEWYMNQADQAKP